MFDTSKACGVYSIANMATGRVYIGQTITNFDTRWRAHRRDLRIGRHKNTDLLNDWHELGSEAFQFSVVCGFYNLHICYTDALRTLERTMIVTAECWLYNATKLRLYRYDEEKISWLYTRRFDQYIRTPDSPTTPENS
jgi:hypothetical protein